MADDSTDKAVQIELARVLFLASQERDAADGADRKAAWEAAKPEMLRTARRVMRMMDAGGKIGIVPLSQAENA